MSLTEQELELLKSGLESRFVIHLPALLDQNRPESENRTKNLSRALSALVLKDISDIEEKQACQYVTDDTNDKGLDAIYYHAATKTLYLVQSKLKRGDEFSLDEANAFCQGVRKIICQDFENFNDHILARKLEIEQAVEECDSIQLVIAYAGSRASANALQAINELLVDQKHGEERLNSNLIEFGADRILSALRGSNAYQRVDTTLKLECHRAVDGGHLSYIGLVALKDLVDLHNKYGKALYVKNIRTFLGRKTDVNSAIQRTLKEKAGHFWYLNNGVTALCENIEPKDVRDGKKRIKLQGISIINGAQTIASSATAATEVDISAAKVLLTLIKSPPESDFGKSVTRARNHQNPVSLFNFSALDEEQERLRRDVANLNIDYVYKDGADDAGSNSITINDAVYALSCLQNDPRFLIWLKRDPAIILNPDGEYYRSLFSANLTAYRLVNSVLVYRKIQEKLTPVIKSSADAERLCYKHGNLVLASVLMKNFTGLIDRAQVILPEDIENKISQPFDEARETLWSKVRPMVPPQTEDGPGPLAIFKNQGTATLVLKATMLAFYALEDDPVVAIKERQTTYDQSYPNNALFEYLNTKIPQVA